jgi:hypothetical protein
VPIPTLVVVTEPQHPQLPALNMPTTLALAPRRTLVLLQSNKQTLPALLVGSAVPLAPVKPGPQPTTPPPSLATLTHHTTTTNHRVVTTCRTICSDSPPTTMNHRAVPSTPHLCFSTDHQTSTMTNYHVDQMTPCLRSSPTAPILDLMAHVRNSPGSYTPMLPMPLAMPTAHASMLPSWLSP